MGNVGNVGNVGNGWQVGIDIGGTFTDVVAARPADGALRTAKVETRTDDRVAGLHAALAAVGLDWLDVDDLIHGTTMVTNAIVENNLAKVALIATQGFSDTLAIGRQNRRYLYNLDLPPKPEPQVPEERRFEVSERLDHQGHILKNLDTQSIDGVIEQILETDAEAVAVSLLHSYADPRHEEELGRRLAVKFPFVALSNRVNPEAREYERTATTVLSASVMPLVAGYLDRLESAKPASTRLHLFHSAGGMASPAALRDLPLSLATSGPAAGVAAAGRIATELGIDQALSFDMGGTTTDVCLILDGKAQISSDRSLGDRPMRQAMVAVEAIGAGGGSIARLDHGALRVGPESAGANPGPACYGRGGVHPTVTDANLVLGIMDGERIIGGNLHLDTVAARTAMAPLATAMDMTIEATALGIVRVANATMVRALRRITVERGIDGRQCTLLAYGGAGPMHAVDVARAFGISKVVVPAHSSVFSALGCVSAEMSYSQQRTLRMAGDEWDGAVLDDARRSLLKRLSAPLITAGYDEKDMVVAEIAAVRYSGQSYAIEITDPAFDYPDQLGRAFVERHKDLYGFATDEPWELVSIRKHVSIPRSQTGAVPAAEKNTENEPQKTTDCFFNGDAGKATPRYDRATLSPGKTLCGPCVIEDDCSTVIIPPGASVNVDAQGHLHIDVGVAS
ncbi:MAG: hydantoinase/oxoprolinase family protein [Rhodospirillales bacterium]|nr:hydantoinase/oxoprolinase family protein [Rhodospirillales bacterium]